MQAQSNTYARWYRDWTLSGALACAIAGFPTTPAGPLLLWAVILPGLGWLLLRPRPIPTERRKPVRRSRPMARVRRGRTPAVALERVA